MVEVITGVISGVFGIMRRKYELMLVGVLCMGGGSGYYILKHQPLPKDSWNVLAIVGITILTLMLVFLFSHLSQREDKVILFETDIRLEIQKAGTEIAGWLSNPPPVDVKGDLLVSASVSIRLKTLKSGRYASILVNGIEQSNTRIKIG